MEKNEKLEADIDADIPEVKELTEADLSDEAADWKEKFQETHKKLMESSIRQRERTKVLKAELAELKQKQPEKVEKKVEKAPGGTDYAQKAYLKASGLINTGEMELFENELSKYREGTSLDAVLESQDFKSKLALYREEQSTRNATPGSSPRSNATTRNKVEYWIDRDDFPEDTPDNRKLRQDTVNARIAREKSARGMR